MPLVTYALIGVCVVIYLGQVILPRIPLPVVGDVDLTNLLAYAPIFTASWLGDNEPWRMLTSALVHSPTNPTHLLFNMFALWFVGRVLEPELGRLRYGALLALSAFGGSVAVLFLSNPVGFTLGASGAVFGLFGALFVLLRSVRSQQTAGIVVLIAVNLSLGFFIPNISWQGHIGGLLVGAACAAILTAVPRGPRRALWQGLGLLGIAAALVALTIVGAHTLPPPYAF